MEREIERPPVCPLTARMHSLPRHQHPHQTRLVTVDGPTPTHHNHSEALVVSLRVHSWWCVFWGFGQMYNDVYLSLSQSVFTALINLSASPLHPSLPTRPLATMDLYIVSIVLPFSKMSYSWNHTACSLFRSASFT